MSNSFDIDEIRCNLKATITSCKGGVVLNKLESDYIKVIGEPIPYRQLEFNSLREFVESLQSFKVENHGHDLIVSVLSNEKTIHLEKMIKKQKTTKKVKAHKSSTIFYSKYSNKSEIINGYKKKYHTLKTVGRELEGVLPSSVNESKSSEIVSRNNDCPDTLTSIKVTNFKESKMPESGSRNTNKCKNCLVCEKVTTIQEHNDINKLLANVQLWDTKIQNQYKRIESFECLICSFKTQQFNEWKCHITSISHLAEYHMIQDTYSHVCDYKNCKVLLFGSKKSLCEHKTNHSDKLIITSISILMAEVMNRYISKKKPLYYCSRCRRFEDKPIHTIAELLNFKNNKKNIIEYYCKYCRVTFVCSPEMLDYHSLSVEHMTIKCLDQLFSEAKVNSRKIKLSEISIQTIENKKLPVNLIGQEKSNKNLQNGNAVNSKQNYTNYINHKLKLLKLLKINKDRIIRTTSYYCNICDFMADEKHTWDKHNETVHPDNINNSTVFCTTCSMFILFNNFEEHNITTEHCNLLKFIQLFSSIRKKPILPLNNTSSQNERNKSDKTTNASIKICDVITSPPNSSLTTISTVSSHEPNIDLKIQELNTMIHGETSNNGVELNDAVFLNTLNTNETTAEESDGNPIFISSLYQKNVADLKRMEVFNKDKMYGEYVTQRLKYIENATVKHHIKLEIDNIFYSNMKNDLLTNYNC